MMRTHSQEDALEALREATRPAHERLEAVPLFSAWKSGDVRLEAYAGFLRVMALIHAAVDRAYRGEDGELRDLAEACGARGREAERDLASIGAPDKVDAPSMRHALIAAEDVLRATLDDPLSRIGALYVVYGSRHGARTLRRMAGAGLPLARDGFWTSGMEGFADRWKRLTSVLRQHSGGDGTAGARELASRLFACLQRAMGELHPMSTTPRPAAAMTNPEAGSHAVATEPRVLVAALMAGLRCWRAFPYYEARYAERGKRFAASDSAWLATLIDEPETVVLGQVDWLGRLLACRGMPRMLLEHHLRLLYEDLKGFAGVDDERAGSLLSAADDLQKNRTSSLDETAVRELERSLAARFSGPPPLSGVPALIAAAVTDAECGIDRAVPTLLDWLADENRFDAAWCRAVRDLEREARLRATER